MFVYILFWGHDLCYEVNRKQQTFTWMIATVTYQSSVSSSLNEITFRLCSNVWLDIKWGAYQRL